MAEPRGVIEEATIVPMADSVPSSETMPHALDASAPRLLPADEANATLLEAVHPERWSNPEPRGTYDLVVIGGGTAGLVSAFGAVGLGARVALVEHHLLGGDCLNVGCVPSKALLRSARIVGEVRRAEGLGVQVDRVEPHFDAIMRRMRERRAGLSVHDSAERLRSAGVDVFFGTGAFSGRRTVDVEGRTLRFGRAVIAAGGRPAAPPIPGLAEVPYLTNETVFWLTDLPRRLVVIGAGPIGCEMSQAFARFGSVVSLLDASPHVLSRESADAAAIVQRQLVTDGVELVLGARVASVSATGAEIRVAYDSAGGERREVVGDRVLVAAGRAPNIEALGLEAAGVQASKHGVVVNDYLQTTNRRVYAAGDVCSSFKFTHTADAQARIVIQNALFFGRQRTSGLVIPWCTYTDPEIAHVGLREADARALGHRVETITVPLTKIDRAVLDEATEGFIRVHHERGRLLGCTIVASHAGEMIGEASYALTHAGTLAALSSTIHPYPTQAEAFGKAGDAYRRSSLTLRVRQFLERYFRWTRW